MKESSYKVGKYISSKLENNSYRMILNLKACVRYFSFFQPMITLKKLWKMLFISSKKIFRFLYFPLLSFSPVSRCSKRWSKINLRVYYVITCPNKNLKTHIVWYLDKESRSDIETWSINRVLRAKRTFKTWNVYFAQILTEVVEKQHVLTPLNFFFKFSHYLTLFPIFSVHVNWIIFYVTAHLFKFYYQQILRKICHVVTKAEHEAIILYEFEKW